jgi:phosphoribosylformylglycinamidine (FGAM) synthase-like amidotransferase family enzyme
VPLVVHDGLRPIGGDAVLVTDDLGAEAVSALRAFAGDGGAVLGIGAGVRALLAAGLLRAALAPPAAAAATHVRVEGRATPFTWAIPAGRVLAIDAPAATLAPTDGADPGQVVLRYCDAAGGVVGAAVAGLCDARARVVGLLPGAAAAQVLATDLGRQLLGSLDLARARGWR